MGAPKGLLTHEGETLLARAVRIASSVAPVVIVGDAHEYGVASIADDPPGIGPIGGLASLLRDGSAIALACDMPFVEASHLRALIEAPDALIVAPRRGQRWEPLCARYDARVLPTIRARIATGDYSLQRLFAEVAVRELELDPRALDDWDTPDDVKRPR